MTPDFETLKAQVRIIDFMPFSSRLEFYVQNYDTAVESHYADILLNII